MGDMADVYEAVDTTLKSEVAVKVLPEMFAVDPPLMGFQRKTDVRRTNCVCREQGEGQRSDLDRE